MEEKLVNITGNSPCATQFMSRLAGVFDVHPGEPRAWMDIPQRGGSYERIQYKVVGFSGYDAPEKYFVSAPWAN